MNDTATFSELLFPWNFFFRSCSLNQSKCPYVVI